MFHEKVSCNWGREMMAESTTDNLKKSIVNIPGRMKNTSTPRHVARIKGADLLPIIYPRLYSICLFV